MSAVLLPARLIPLPPNVEGSCMMGRCTHPAAYFLEVSWRSWSTPTTGKALAVCEEHRPDSTHRLRGE